MRSPEKLGVDGHRRLPGELGGIQHRLACSPNHSATALIEWTVADSHDLDRAARRGLHLDGRRLQGAGETVTGLTGLA